MFKAEEPEYEKELDMIHLITSVSGNTVTIFVTTSYQELIELGISHSQFLDQAISQEISMNAEVYYGFNFDI